MPKTMTVISSARLPLVQELFANTVLVPYDNARYRNNAVEEFWQGRKIAALPDNCLALFAKCGNDDKGQYISLMMLMPIEQQLAKIA